MAHKMHEWITTGEPPALLPFLSSFAKSASGSSSNDDDDDDDDDGDDDDDDDDDPDADKSEDDLRAELKSIRGALAKANGQSAKRRKLLRQREAELEEARKPKSKKSKDDDDDGPDLDTIRHEAKSEGEKAGIARAKKAEAKSALLAAGVNPERVTKAVGLLDLDELDLDDDGLDGVDDAIEDLRKSWPELFAKKRKRREGVGGDRGPDPDKGSGRGKEKSASEKAADKLLGRS